MNKIILFTQRVEISEQYIERRDCADQRIASFIVACGFIPIPVPNKPEITYKLIELTAPSGIILTGGNSLTKYGGNAPERDSTDEYLIRYALESKVPLYGFCRGMEAILDYFGNKLENVYGHTSTRHQISGIEESTEVNSYHNQACIELSSQDLQIVMRSDDGVIEKIVHKNAPIIGTMWHPEREHPFRKVDISLVRSLVRKDI